MARLDVQNGYHATIPGLGKVRSLQRLSQKRITKAVREELRAQYGYAKVEVSCTSCFKDGHWEGSCAILGKPYIYDISDAEARPEG
jgi:hypothetical protein